MGSIPGKSFYQLINFFLFSSDPGVWPIVVARFGFVANHKE